MGTTNPYYATQLWLMSSDADEERVENNENSGENSSENSENKPVHDNVDTGDSASVILWAVLMLAAVCGLVFLKKMKNEM